MRCLVATLGVFLLLGASVAAASGVPEGFQGNGYLDPVDRGITLPHGYGELGLGYRSTWGNFSYDLDGSRIQGERLVPFRSYRDQASVLAGAYGLTDTWEIGFEVPFVWRRFHIDRGDLVDTEGRLITAYPDDRTSGMGDARFHTVVRPWERVGLRFDLKTATGADNFFPTRMPDARPVRYIGSGQPNIDVAVMGEHVRERYRLDGALGYRFRLSGISNFLLDDFAPRDEFFLTGAARVRLHPNAGIGAEASYMHEVAANSVSVLDVRVPVWLSVGPWELRVSGTTPVYGKDYPALFPEQLADPRPLLGPGVEVFVFYRIHE